MLSCCCYYTHPFNGPLSGTTQVSRYQKGTINPDFTEARDSGWQWHQLGHMQVCTSLAPDNHASTPPLSFLQAGCPSCRPTNSTASKHYYYDDMPSSNWHRRGAYHFTVPGAISCYECVASSITIKALDSQLEGVHITIPTLTISLLRKIKMPNKTNCFSILFISSKHYNIHFSVVGCMR